MNNNKNETVDVIESLLHDIFGEHISVRIVEATPVNERPEKPSVGQPSVKQSDAEKKMEACENALDALYASLGVFNNPDVSPEDIETFECPFDDDDDDDELIECEWGIPDIHEVLFCGKSTVIKWADGTKTYTVCGENESYDEYAGFMSAVMKKLFGSTSIAKRVCERRTANPKAKSQKKRKVLDKAASPVSKKLS